MTDLTRAYTQLKESRPRLRIRDAAETLGVTELELVCLDSRTVRLRLDPKAWLEGLTTVGRAMALTRNPWCVHERKGAWTRPTVHAGRMGLVVGSDIDLRLFLGTWAHLIHTTVDNARGPLDAFQAFDAHGRAVHKVYRLPTTDADAWASLVEDLTDPAPEALAPTPVPPAPEPSDDVDADALRDAWSKLQDTHDFHAMLRTLGVHRLSAMRHAGAPWTRPVHPREAIETVLTGAAEDGQDIMVFVGNAGCIQIHTGPVRHVKWHQDWLNVLDEDFNLHLDADGVDSAWVVQKPTSDGPVHSLELYAEDGTTIAQLFGARKPGVPEDPAWAARLAHLPAHTT